MAIACSTVNMLQKNIKRRIRVEALLTGAPLNPAVLAFCLITVFPLMLSGAGSVKENANSHVIFFEENTLSESGKEDAKALTDYAAAYIKIRNDGKFSDESVKLLMDSVTRNPYGIPPLKLLVAHWSRSRNYKEMLKNFLPLAKKYPDAIRLNIITSDTLSRLEREKDALHLLERSVDCIDFSPRGKVSPVLLGELVSKLSSMYVELGDVDAGEDLWDDALACSAIGDQLIVRMAAADFFAEFADQGPDGFFAGWSKRRYRRKLEENLTQVEKLWAEKKMNNALLVSPILRIFKRYSMGDRAEKILLKMLLENPYNSSAMLMLAQTYSDFRRYADAVRVWQVIIDTDYYKRAGVIWKFLTRGRGGEGDFYMELASAALRGGDYKEATRAFDWFLLLNPEDSEALFQLGIAYMRMREYTKAILKLEQVKGLPEADFYRARCYVNEGRYEKALEALNDAEKTAKKYKRDAFLDKRFYVEYAFVADQAGEFKKSEAALKKLLKDHPDDPMLNNFLGYLWAEKGVNLDEARKLVERALEKDSENAAYVDSMAWVLYKKKQYEDAVDRISKALKLEGEIPDAVIAEHAGDIYQALGDKKNALKYWKMALEIYSEDIDRDALKNKIDQIRNSQFEKL